MTRAAIALVAIVVLTLSAGFTSTSIHTSALRQARPAAQVRSALLAGEGDLRLLGSVRQAASPAAPEDGPAPALLAYLALVIVGSAAAIGSVRASQRRDI